MAVAFVDMPAKRSLLESERRPSRRRDAAHPGGAGPVPSLIAVQPSFNFIEPTAFVKDHRAARRRLEIARARIRSDRSRCGLVGARHARHEPGRGGDDTMDQLMQSLAAGRFDVAVNDGFSGLLVIRRLKLERARAARGAAAGAHSAVPLPARAAPWLVPKVEQAIRSMQASGELERVRQQAMARLLKDANAELLS
jgi:hypothetical protein